MEEAESDHGSRREQESGSFVARHPIVTFTVLRLVLLLASAVLLWVLGARGILLIVLAFAVSAMLSFVLLRSPRAGTGEAIGSYFTRLNERIERSTRAEDESAGAEDSVNSGSVGEASPTVVRSPEEPTRSERND